MAATTVRLPPEIAEALDRVAASSHRTRSNLIVLYVRRGLLAVGALPPEPPPKEP